MNANAATLIVDNSISLEAREWWLIADTPVIAIIETEPGDLLRAAGVIMVTASEEDRLIVGDALQTLTLTKLSGRQVWI